METRAGWARTAYKSLLERRTAALEKEEKRSTAAEAKLADVRAHAAAEALAREAAHAEAVERMEARLAEAESRTAPGQPGDEGASPPLKVERPQPIAPSPLPRQASEPPLDAELLVTPRPPLAPPPPQQQHQQEHSAGPDERWRQPSPVPSMMSSVAASATTEQRLSRPTWKRDASVDACEAPHCGARFTLMARRHHCRACGNIFCEACSSTRVPLPELGYGRDPQRVCAACGLRALTGALRESSHSPATLTSAHVDDA